MCLGRLPSASGGRVNGGLHRTFAGRPGPARQQAPRDRRPARHPLTVSLTSGKGHDVTQLIPPLDAIPRIRGVRGQPRHARAGCSPTAATTTTSTAASSGPAASTPKIARKGTAHGSGLGKNRWVVERTFAWLHQLKRPRIRYEIRADLRLALLQLACSMICLRRLRTSF